MGIKLLKMVKTFVGLTFACMFTTSVYTYPFCEGKCYGIVWNTSHCCSCHLNLFL